VRQAYTFSRHCVCLRCCRYTDQRHAQDRCPVANNIDSTGIEKWKRTARASAVAHPVLPLQVVELSEGRVTQVGPPLHVLGAQVDPVKSQIDSTQLSATTYISEASVYIQQVHASCLRAADTQIRSWHAQDGAQSLTALTVQDREMEAHRTRRAVDTQCCHCK
jgi:hypothetical protein